MVSGVLVRSIVNDLQVRIAGERADMPTIFITGYGDVPMTVRAMKAGAVEFLAKPFAEGAVKMSASLGLGSQADA